MGGKHSNSRKDSITEYVKFSDILSKTCEAELYISNTPISSPKLEDLWKNQLSSEHLHILMLYFARLELTIDTFIKFYHHHVDGTPDEKAILILSLFESTKEIKTYDLTRYVSAVLNSLVILLKNNSTYTTWLQIHISNEFNETETLSKYISSDLGIHTQVDLHHVSSWLYKSPMFIDFSNHVYKTIYNIEIPSEIKLPEPIINTSTDKSLLMAGEILFFSLSLRKNYVENWRLLYSSKSYGNSWATFCKCITAQGPTLVLIKSSNGAVIGGFASTSWNFHPDFFGNDYSFIFQLRPTIQIFEASSYNKNFQYFNSGQNTLPNGLGMGGQFGYWGFFISSNFEKCITSETCTTFRNYKLKSLSKEFVIQDLEIWGVDKPDPTPAELGERNGTCLDKDPSVRALLELAGRKSYATDIDIKPVETEKQ